MQLSTLATIFSIDWQQILYSTFYLLLNIISHFFIIILCIHEKETNNKQLKNKMKKQ
jgi:hypothetical protein